MPRLVLTFIALAILVATGSLTNRSSAAPLGHPFALTGAAKNLSVLDSVHCRRGWRHHRPNRSRRADGCRRYRGGGVIVAPRYRYVTRDGVRVRVRVGTGSRTTVRTGARTTVRGKVKSGGTVKGGGDVKGGAPAPKAKTPPAEMK